MPYPANVAGVGSGRHYRENGTVVNVAEAIEANTFADCVPAVTVAEGETWFNRPTTTAYYTNVTVKGKYRVEGTINCDNLTIGAGGTVTLAAGSVITLAYFQ